MTREKLIAQLEHLTEAAMRHSDTRPAAAVLSTLLGALLSHSDVELMHFVTQFSEAQIAVLKSKWN